ncbi:MAG: YCF48-related protein [Gemmataceae bacterium]
MRSIATLLTALLLGLPAQAAETPAFEDACVRAVHFFEDRQGWAVGDDGVIWHTIDGGKNWERQSSGVRASLRSVQFLDPFTGWIAGREELPGGGAAGVVLYTRDGGLKWRRILVNSLPGLHLVRFVDERTGYLAGDGSDQFPSGVFSTTDGGKTWQPVAGNRAPSWRAGDFSAEGGALAGAWNRLATVRRAQVFSLDMDSLGGRTIQGLQLRGNDAVAVGQGGLVLLSRNTRGSSWDYARMELPGGVRESLDFQAVHGVDEHIWVVGRPGSVALHSPDRGRTWKLVPLGQSMPLHGVFFRDAKHGWAVGELGTIVATTDGGQTWQVQRRGGQRLAVLCVHARPGGATLEAVARLGAEDGYLTAGLCLTSPEPSSAELSRVGESCRFVEAFRQAGGAVGETLWQFPLSTHLSRSEQDKLLTVWNRMHAGEAPQQMLAQLVLALRMYRPDVVLTDAPGAGAESMVVEALTEAFRQASDPRAFPEQMSALGLEAHRPKKLYSLAGAGAMSPVRVDLTTLSPRLGTTLREFSTAPLTLIGRGHPPADLAFQLLANDLPGSATHRELMQGISLAAGGVARREMNRLEELDPAVVKAARQRAGLWAIAEAPPSELTSSERLLAQIGPTIADMPADAGARVAHGLAWQYARKGQWALARETFLLLVDRYPTHPLAVDGYRWLLQHQASSEARRRHEMGQFLVVGQTTGGVPGGKQQPLEAKPANPEGAPKDEKVKRRLGDVPSFGTESNQTLAYISTPEDVRRWHQGALALEAKLSAFGPLYANDPAMQFAVQSARRQLGDVKAALDWYRQFAAAQPEGPWKKAALAELWLSNRVGAPPKPVVTLRPTGSRPYLDGKLDDPCWQEAKSVKLLNAVGDSASRYPTEVRMSHDRDFLYLAVRCGHPTGAGQPAAAARSRDRDLRANDRVSLMLDLDRDYSTCFHLQVDATGCVVEDCWGDRTWNPRWFVAVKRDPEGWTMEAAIPRVALTNDHFTSGKAWAANVVRVMPGQGVQAFSLPAEAPEEAMRPEGMGLLMFSREAEQAATKGVAEPTQR